MLLLSYPSCVYDGSVIQADQNNPHLDPESKALCSNWIQLLHKWNTFLLWGALWGATRNWQHNCQLLFSSTYLCELEALAEFLLAIKRAYKHAIAYWACLGAMQTSFVQKAEKEALESGLWKLPEISVPNENRNTGNASCYLVLFVSIPHQDWNTEASSN